MARAKEVRGLGGLARQETIVELTLVQPRLYRGTGHIRTRIHAIAPIGEGVLAEARTLIAQSANGAREREQNRGVRSGRREEAAKRHGCAAKGARGPEMAPS